MQDVTLNRLNFKITIVKKSEKIAKIFEPTNLQDVKNKGFLDKKLSKLEGHISYKENDYNEFKIFSDRQSVEEVLFQRAV